VNSKNKSSRKNHTNSAAGNLILVFAGLIALYFNSGLADPFNSPKQWLLILTTAWLSGYILFINFSNKRLSLQKIDTLTILVILFQIVGFVIFMLSDQKFISFFGESQRKTGFITYFCLSVYMLFSSKYLTSSERPQIHKIAFITSVVFSAYAIMQFTGNDFVKWSNPYNVIISTLGNPNFAAAFMAVMLSLTFSAIFLKSMKLYLKFFYLTITCLLIILIYLSDAKQGLLAALIGIGFIAVIQLMTLSKKLGVALLTLVMGGAVISIFGMLQIGPLQSLLYKDSVTLRGYYWRAGINMFLENPLTGVGQDRYGANFNQYKDSQFVVERGFELMSSNAHNIFIQIFATGGVFLGISYLSILLYVSYIGLSGIKRLTGDRRVLLTGIYAAWLAYLAQGVVSIENIGMAVWGWVLGGAIVGISKFKIDNQLTSSGSKKAAQPILSMLFLIIAIVFVFNLSTGETNTMKAQVLYNPNSTTSSPELYKVAKNIVQGKLTDPLYKLSAATLLNINGNSNEGIEVIKELIVNDPRNTNALSTLANYYEFEGNTSQAIYYRNEIAKYDPYNCKNYLKLGSLYKSLNDLDGMNKMLQKIISIAPNSEVATSAKLELVS
jgi:O-antigen ligase